MQGLRDGAESGVGGRSIVAGDGGQAEIIKDEGLVAGAHGILFDAQQHLFGGFKLLGFQQCKSEFELDGAS